MCGECNGRGWQWVGLQDNAERVECDQCAGTGRDGSLTLMGTCILAPWALALGIMWLTHMTQIVN